MAVARQAATPPPGTADDSRPLSRRLSARDAFLVNGAFVAALLVLSQLPVLDARPVVRTSIMGAALALLAWSTLLFGVFRRGQEVALEVVLRRPHYLQACVHTSLLVYWGYYWREVYHAAPLILAQVLFAYAFDSLLSWTHRRKFVLGFGPFPIVFSINLFLWFKDPWFYWQFAMLALGLTAKEFLRWQRDGVNTHIFNPSSFPLAVTGLVLLLADASDITWGFEVAQTQFYPPQIFLFLFLISLPGQYFFGVTPMTMAAVVTTFGFSQLYYLATGSYYFVDSHVPIAVFLGMHLLFTDPATSPRTELGRILFGVLYGLSVVLLYELLMRANAPAFYDKLLQVPLLNLCVIWLDRLARSPWLKAVNPANWGPALRPRSRHLAYMGVWGAAFAAMSATGHLGDDHPGQYTPFWEQACAANRPDACLNLYFFQEGHCADGSAWACNEAGILLVERYGNRATAASAFDRACTLQLATACDNATALASGGALRRAPPTAADYRIVLRGTKGPLDDDVTQEELFARACKLGWTSACG
jgi:hypothetical protein